MNPTAFSWPSILTTYIGAPTGSYMRMLVPILASGSLAYWNYRQAKRKGTWAWSRVFLLMGAVAVFLLGFMLPLTTSKAMETHPNRTLEIMIAGMVVYFGLLYYLFTKYPVKPREQVAAPSSPNSASDIK
jgi:cytochrome c biogenesis protein CcdA